VQAESGIAAVSNPYERLPLFQQRQRLPIYKLRRAFLYAVEQFQTVLIPCLSASSSLQIL
jgi:hypothetical protein